MRERRWWLRRSGAKTSACCRPGYDHDHDACELIDDHDHDECEEIDDHRGHLDQGDHDVGDLNCDDDEGDEGDDDESNFNDDDENNDDFHQAVCDQSTSLWL